MYQIKIAINIVSDPWCLLLSAELGAAAVQNHPVPVAQYLHLHLAKVRNGQSWQSEQINDNF